MIRSLALGCVFNLPLACYADCRIQTARTPLRAVVGGGQGCSHIIEAKLCAPVGKAIKSSEIKDLNISPNVELADREIRTLDGNCVQARLTVRARTIYGSVFWQVCSEGSYDGRIDLAYCR
jgi:hypothetical protein